MKIAQNDNEESERDAEPGMKKEKEKWELRKDSEKKLMRK